MLNVSYGIQEPNLYKTIFITALATQGLFCYLNNVPEGRGDVVIDSNSSHSHLDNEVLNNAELYIIVNTIKYFISILLKSDNIYSTLKRSITPCIQFHPKAKQVYWYYRDLFTTGEIVFSILLDKNK